MILLRRRQTGTRVLLRAFPAAFRSRHGDSMMLLYEDMCRATATRRERIRLAIELVAQGLAARRDAGVRRSNRAPTPQQSFRPDHDGAVDRLLQDLRYALRSLRNSPGFTATVALTLGLGIGANTAIFAIVDAVLLNALPLPHADRLVRVFALNPERGPDGVNVSHPNFSGLMQQSQAFEHGAVLARTSRSLNQGEFAERVETAAISAGFFATLGVRPVLGRGFAAADQDVGAAKVVIVSEALWQQRLGGDAAALGTALRINGAPHSIVGVVPRPLASLPFDLYVPLTLSEVVTSRSNRFLTSFARMTPEATLDQARTEAATVAARLESEFPDVNDGWGFSIVPLQQAMVGYMWIALLLLLGIVGVVLLIACANVAGLTMARAATRSRDIALRAAIGAGRGRLVRQLLAESVLVGMLGGAIGVAIGALTIGLLRSGLSLDLPNADMVSLDGRVLFFAWGLSLLTGVLFGLAPALKATGAGMSDALREGGVGASAGPRRHRLRRGLVIAEVALAMVLLVGAGMLTRTLLGAVTRQVGFDPNDTITMQLDVPGSRYSTTALISLVEQLDTNLAALPGIDGFALGSEIPMSSSRTSRGIKRAEEPDPPFEQTNYAGWITVSPGYFEVLGIRLLRGRQFAATDNAAGERVIIINESLAQRLFGADDPIGQQVQMHSDENTARTVVGVIADVTTRMLQGRLDPQMYTPFAQMPSRRLMALARTRADISAAMPPIRAQVARLDADIPVWNVRSMNDVLWESVREPRIFTSLVAAFAALAVILAVIGLYGVIAYAVTDRRREIGVRIALGAGRGDVSRLIVFEGLRLATIGAGLGLIGGMAADAGLQSLFFGAISPRPLTYVVTLGLLLATAALASYLPARRAARLDPVDALRSE